MYSKITFVAAIVGLAVIGVLGQKNSIKPFSSGLTLAALDAFADSESNSETDPETSGGSGSNTPPDSWNYVPGRYIKCDTKTYKLACTSEDGIYVDGQTLYGDYKKGWTYSVVIEIKNCDGVNKNSWCDQRQVGSRVLYVTNPEVG